MKNIGKKRGIEIDRWTEQALRNQNRLLRMIMEENPEEMTQEASLKTPHAV